MFIEGIDSSSLEKAGTIFSLKVTLNCLGAATTAFMAGLELTTFAWANAGPAGASTATAIVTAKSDLRID
jgi:hypothetical protein